MKLHLSYADRSAPKRVAKDSFSIRHGGIGSYRSRKATRATFHFLFRPVLIGRGRQEDRVRDAAALHMREARVRIPPQVQVGIEHGTAPIWCGLGVDERRDGGRAQQ
jgi:hypothetical protein